MAKFPEISHFLNLHDSSLGRHVKAASRKSLEIQVYLIIKLTRIVKIRVNLSRVNFVER